jgi:hypothetical protein
MIEKRAFLLAWSVTAAMTAAGLWVLLQNPGIQPILRIHADGSVLRSATPLTLFHLPAVTALVIVLLDLKLRFAPPQRTEPWRKWQAKFLIGFSLLAPILYAYILARSLNLPLPFGPEAAMRGGFVALGLLIAVFANSQPKLPWLNSKFSLLPPLNDADGARLLRIHGALGVAAGLILMLGGAFLPLSLMAPLLIGFAIIAVVMLGTLVWFRRRSSVS